MVTRTQTTHFAKLPQVIIVLLVVVIVLLPFYPRLSNFSLIALGIAGLLNALYRKEINFPPFPIYFFMSLYLVRIIWLIGSDDISYGLRMLETHLPFIAIPLIFSLFKLKSTDADFVAKVYVTMVFSIIVFSFGNLFVDYLNSGSTMREYLDTHFVTAQYYAQLNMLTWKFAHYSFLSVMVIYGIHILVYAKTPWIFICIYALVALAFFIFTGSKSGIALLGVAFVVYFCIHFRNILLNRISLIIFFCLTLALLTYVYRANNIKEFLLKTDSQRYQFFTVGATAWIEKPFFGYGTGEAKKIIQDYDLAEKIGFSRSEYEGNRANHPHNEYLTELLQFGIVGSIPFFVFLGSIYYFSIKTQNWSLLSIVITFSLLMLVESPFGSHKGLVPFTFLLCLFSFNRQSKVETLS